MRSLITRRLLLILAVVLVVALPAAVLALRLSAPGSVPPVPRPASARQAPAPTPPVTGEAVAAPTIPAIAGLEAPAAEPTTTPLPPTPAAPRPYHIALQAGHYKNNEMPPELARLVGSTGTSGGGRLESDLNIDISNRVAKLLRARGAIVDVLPATVPTGYTADVFVAIHADGNSSTAARGFKISTRWMSPVSVADALLVSDLMSAYRTATGLPEDLSVTRNMRGYYSFAPWRTDYRVSNFTPSAIVEMGFMTNAADRAVMFDGADEVAGGIAAGIGNFLSEVYGSPATYRPFGWGVGDRGPDGAARPYVRPTGHTNTTVTAGDWKLVMLGGPAISVYSSPGTGPVVGTLPGGQVVGSQLRNGEFYQVTLPGGEQGWVDRLRVIVQF